MTVDVEGVVVYTALFGDHDVLRSPPPQTQSCRWVAVTDRDRDVPGWNVIVTPPSDEPRVAARSVKIRPWDHLGDHTWSIWIDANVVIESAAFVEQVIRGADAHALTLFRHPKRCTIAAEAEACVRTGRADERALAQVESYLAEGLAPDAPLWATGVLVRHNDPSRWHPFSEAWLDEVRRWTARDQLSLPYVAWRLGARLRALPYSLYAHEPARLRFGRFAVGLPGVRGLAARSARASTRGRNRYTRAVRSLLALPQNGGGGANPWFRLDEHLSS